VGARKNVQADVLAAVKAVLEERKKEKGGAN
jgi:hypothetical protein